MMIHARPPRVFRSRTIAVLDDDGDLRDELCETLQGLGHTAIGLKGPEEIGGAHAHVLVLDLAMPKVDGVDVLNGLARSPDAPSIVLISGHGEAVLGAAGRAAESAGLTVLGVLAKPLDIDALVALLDREERKAGPAAPSTVADVRAPLERALAEGTLGVHFQPKVRVDDLGFAGAEALLAGSLPGVPHAPPPTILDAARALPNGLVRLTDAVLRQAVAACRTWTEAGARGAVSVNLPLEALLAPDAVANFVDIAREAGVPTSMVTFELLEDAVYDSSAEPLGVLTKLRIAGFGLALDDVGQRQSGLLQLANLPVTEIKIDLEIVRQARTFEKARGIFDSLAALGRRLGIRVCAEGVETEADLQFVRQHPVDYLQGYVVSRKRPLDDLLQWLANRPEDC